MDFLPDIPPDFGPQRATAFNFDEVQFGDGYAQRRPAGINGVRSSWTINWTLLEQHEFDELHDFLSAREGVYAFWWQPPWDSAARRWVCQDLSAQVPTSYRRGSISATFKEDHNP